MLNVTSKQEANFVLEEVFQILLESLEHDPFSQHKNNLCKLHISRLREILGPNFSVCLAESGNFYFSTLKSTTNIAMQILSDNSSNDRDFEIYELLSTVSQQSMSFGIHSEITINTLLKLHSKISDSKITNLEISDVIETAIQHLLSSVNNQSIKHLRQ